MSLDPRMLNSVVRISGAGDLLGTGSIIGVPSERFDGWRWPYIVTAHHVIANEVEITLDVPDPLARGELLPSIPVDGWRQPLPGIDLAIAPFPHELVPRFQAVPLDHFVPDGTVVPLGGTIYYLGIFAPLDVPMARGGSLGALDVPITKPDYTYNADLVDCRSYGGFSGSPCFSTLAYPLLDDTVDFPPDVVPPNPDGSFPKLGRMSYIATFCGIFTAHYSDEGGADGIVSRYGVGVMLPCDYVRDALMTDEAMKERREADDTRQAARDAGIPPLENAAAEPTEFERFEDLTRKLVHMPKPKA
jgi:hypothetical protein